MPGSEARPLPDADLELVMRQTQGLWAELRDARLLLTGGTGFVGRWMLASLLAANRRDALGLRVSVLTRDPRGFAAGYRELATDDAVDLLPGDVRTFAWPDGAFTHVVHGATPSDAGLNEGRPAEMLAIIEDGTRQVLDFCAARGVARVLLLSSGAVYAPPAPAGGYTALDPLGPAWPEEPSAYHAGKRVSEQLALSASSAHLGVTIARLFAFVGPYLPLDRHFAIGNFMKDALDGRTVVVHGDGSPVRSYLYAAEMAAWLWTMLLHERAVGQTYNVGSERAVSIAETARAVAAAADPPVAVEIAGGETRPRDIYLPCTARAREELGLVETVGLDDSVRRTLAWHRARTGSSTAAVADSHVRPGEA